MTESAGRQLAVSEVAAVPGEIRQFGACAASNREELLSALTLVAGCAPAQLQPVLGAIGADYLGAFAEAQQRYSQSLNHLADLAGAISVAANNTASVYESRDTAFAAALKMAPEGHQL